MSMEPNASHRVDDFDNIRMVVVVGNTIPRNIEEMAYRQPGWMLKRIEGRHPTAERKALRDAVEEAKTGARIIVMTQSIFATTELNIAVMLNGVDPQRGFSREHLIVLDTMDANGMRKEATRLEIGKHGFRIASFDANINEQSLALYEIAMTMEAMRHEEERRERIET